MFTTWLEINRLAIAQNVSNLRSLLAPETQFMAVVKANAYGHGLVTVAQMVIAAGADRLGVNTVDEGVVLRQAGIRAPILVLGAVARESLVDAAAHQLAVVVPSYDWLADMQPVLISLTYPLSVHLKIETGLHRLGLMDRAEALRVIELIQQNPQLIWEGTYSHLAAMEERHDQFSAQQAAVLTVAVNDFRRRGFDPGVVHLAASAGALLDPNLQFAMVRCGIAIYGLWPSTRTQAAFGQSSFLTPALTWKTRIIQIKEVAKGTIGYGRTYRVRSPMYVAVIPVGYAEGYDRHLSNKGEVLVGGRRCRVLGRVAMNMTMIDVTSIMELRGKKDVVRIGDEVVLIGKQGNEEITADELADKIGTINYEVVTRIPAHLPRVYTGVIDGVSDN